MDYKVVLTKDRETGWFVAEAPSLPGCVKKHPEEKIPENFESRF